MRVYSSTSYSCGLHNEVSTISMGRPDLETGPNLRYMCYAIVISHVNKKIHILSETIVRGERWREVVAAPHQCLQVNKLHLPCVPPAARWQRPFKVCLRDFGWLHLPLPFQVSCKHRTRFCNVQFARLPVCKEKSAASVTP